MKRGDVVTVAMPGDYGKPRPALIVQSDRVAAVDSLLVCPFTTDSQDAPLYRIDVLPNAANGLKRPSQLMVDKIAPAPRHKIGRVLGRVDDDTLDRLSGAIALVTGLLDEA